MLAFASWARVTLARMPVSCNQGCRALGHWSGLRVSTCMLHLCFLIVAFTSPACSCPQWSESVRSFTGLQFDRDGPGSIRLVLLNIPEGCKVGGARALSIVLRGCRDSCSRMTGYRVRGDIVCERGGLLDSYSRSRSHTPQPRHPCETDGIRVVVRSATSFAAF